MPTYRNTTPTAIRVIPLGLSIGPGETATVDAVLSLDGLVLVEPSPQAAAAPPAPDEEPT